MKLSLAITSTLLAVASADLEQNVLCGDNKDCEKNCVDGRYHIVVDNANSMYFACTLEEQVKYSNPECKFGLDDAVEEKELSRSACVSVGGTLCQTVKDGQNVNSCLMLDDRVEDFKENCGDVGGVAGENKMEPTTRP